MDDQFLTAFMTLVRKKMGHIDECWKWNNYSHRMNYYPLFRGKKVHRLSCELFNERTTVEKPFVLHSCDHPWCWNPQHLRIGTHEDNMLDRGRVKDAEWV